MPTEYDPDPKPIDLTDELCVQLAAVSTATLAGELQNRGITNAFLAGLAPVVPGVRMVGVAHTLRYVPKAPEFDQRHPGRNMQRHAIETIEPGEVLIMEARGEIDAGTIGDIYTMRVKQRGGAGVVTDGAVRDTPGIAEVGLPVYCRASHGAKVGRLHTALDHQVPIVCAGVTVFPGDVIVGDDEGVVVVPARLAADVAAVATETEERETWGLERVTDGESIDGTFPLGEHRRADYETWRTERDG